MRERDKGRALTEGGAFPFGGRGSVLPVDRRRRK